MSAALRSSVIESLMLVLFVVWSVAFSVTLFHPEIGLVNTKADARTNEQVQSASLQS